MSRFFIFILLLTVCFLTGMLFGISQDPVSSQNEFQPAEENKQAYEDTVMNANHKAEVNNENLSVEEIDIMETSASLTVTQKAASLLEAGVKGFYEIVVGVLYQVAQLFY